MQFGSPEAAVRGGVSAESESVCASIAVMQGDEFRCPVDQCKAKLVVMCPLTMRHDADMTSCKTEESLDDSALGGTYAREAE